MVFAEINVEEEINIRFSSHTMNVLVVVCNISLSLLLRGLLRYSGIHVRCSSHLF